MALRMPVIGSTESLPSAVMTGFTTRGAGAAAGWTFTFTCDVAGCDTAAAAGGGVVTHGLDSGAAAETTHSHLFYKT